MRSVFVGKAFVEGLERGKLRVAIPVMSRRDEISLLYCLLELGKDVEEEKENHVIVISPSLQATEYAHDSLFKRKLEYLNRLNELAGGRLVFDVKEQVETPQSDTDFPQPLADDNDDKERKDVEISNANADCLAIDADAIPASSTAKERAEISTKRSVERLLPLFDEVNDPIPVRDALQMIFIQSRQGRGKDEIDRQKAASSLCHMLSDVSTELDLPVERVCAEIGNKTVLGFQPKAVREVANRIARLELRWTMFEPVLNINLIDKEVLEAYKSSTAILKDCSAGSTPASIGQGLSIISRERKLPRIGRPSKKTANSRHLGMLYHQNAIDEHIRNLNLTQDIARPVDALETSDYAYIDFSEEPDFASMTIQEILRHIPDSLWDKPIKPSTMNRAVDTGDGQAIGCNAVWKISETNAFKVKKLLKEKVPPKLHRIEGKNSWGFTPREISRVLEQGLGANT